MTTNLVKLPLNLTNTEYILYLSYGKDSLTTIEAVKLLGLPLDRIVHAEVWATETIPADLPPMVDFKEKADAIILDRYGIVVEHQCATRRSREREREYVPETYESVFYRRTCRGKFKGTIKGFPLTKGSWCKHLKEQNLRDIREFILPYTRTQETIDESGRNSRFCYQLDTLLQTTKERDFLKAPHEGLRKISCNISA